MFAFIALTIGLVFALAFAKASMNSAEVSRNWSKYKSDPLYMFSAYMFKPDDDPRSRFQFAADNFIDNIMDFIHKIFAVFLQPVMNIFRLFTNSLTQSSSGLFNIRMILGKMWTAFNSMTDIFMRRFYGVFHQLRVTFIKLNESMGKTFGIATSSIYAALSTIQSMLSVFDLMINICVAILIILAVFMIFLPFLLIPFIFLILMVTQIIDRSGQGGQISGLAGVFCFTANTRVATPSGSIPISEVKLGTVLADQQVVKGVFDFQQHAKDMYNVHGVIVSGSHIVYTKEGKACHVSDHPDAIPYTGDVSEVYCLMTSNRRIPIVGNNGILQFADWEELDSEDDGLDSWNAIVYTLLNKKERSVSPNNHNIHSESCFSAETRVSTVFGNRAIETIRPGTYVHNGFGGLSRVTGVVRIHGSEITGTYQYDSTTTLSAGAWMYKDGIWQQPKYVNVKLATENQIWYSLFTESGTFVVGNELVVRDFTDVGSDNIDKTYPMVINELNKKGLVP